MSRSAKKLQPWMKWAISAGAGAAVLGTLALTAAYFAFSPDLKAIQELEHIQLQVPLRVFTRDGKLMAVYGEKRRALVTVADVPKRQIQAFIAAEDDRFYVHHGIDYRGLLRAVWHLVLTGHKGPGGSTLTMQLVDNFFMQHLGRKRTFLWKLKEMIWAVKVEQVLSKNKILELYLNKIFLGHRAFGVGAAAEVYFGKRLDELSLSEMAIIAAIPKAPSRINPITNAQRSRARRNYVLHRMLEEKFISQMEYEHASQEPIRAYQHDRPADVPAPYVAEMVRIKVLNKLGAKAYRGGYKVFTTIDSRLQRAADAALQSGLLAYDQRHGYRGAEAHLDLSDSSTPLDWDRALAQYRRINGLVPGLVTHLDQDAAEVYLVDGQTIALDLAAVKWARQYIDENRTGPAPKSVVDVLQLGDVIRVQRDGENRWRLSQIPGIQGALVAIDQSSGAIRALVGGFSFGLSKFNRATQSRRQPGSNFKPFIYSAALEHGFTAASIINDAPVVFDDPSIERSWRPENYSGRFFGPTRLREGLIHSRNLVSIRILKAIGVDFARQYARRFGFAYDDMAPNLSLALGNATLAPLQVVSGYATIANGGFKIEPYLADRLLAPQRQVLQQADPAVACIPCESLGAPLTASVGENPASENELRLAPRVMDRRNNFIVRSLLKDVIRHGTGRRARSLKRADMGGKTGTTNDQRDAWFSGFSGGLVTTVWVGFDALDKLGERETGARAALPVWIDFMGSALQGVPEWDPPRPPGIVTVRIDPKTGQAVGAEKHDAILEMFREEYAPRHLESGKDDAQNPYDIF